MAQCPGAEDRIAAELTCSVCLSSYQDPASLTCGHNFCRECILKVLKSQREQGRSYSCPICQATYENFPKLQKNFQLGNIVHTFSALHKPGPNEHKILCSYCLGEPNPAVKTCLNCEVSLCQQHLDKHRSKSHIMVEPTESLVDTKCPEHEKLLEYYCEQDQCCICVTCYIAGTHKGHTIMTLKEAHTKKMADLSQMISGLQDTKDGLSQDIEKLRKGLETLKKNSTNLSNPLRDLSDKICSQIKKQYEDILNAIISNEKTKTSEIKTLTEQMENKREEARCAIQELDTLRGQTDDMLFMKDFRRCQEEVTKQDLRMDTMWVLDINIDHNIVEQIESKTSCYISDISNILQQVHRDISAQTQQQVWTGRIDKFIPKHLYMGFSKLQHRKLRGIALSKGNKISYNISQ